MIGNQINRSLRIVFEGVPGAGKSTHSARLARELNAPLVPEYVAFTDAQWRSYPTTTPFYFANDELKERVARYLCDPVVLMDRHYAGALAYGYALSKVRGASVADGECYETNMEWYEREIRVGGLSRPDCVIYLDIPPELSLRRQPRARKSDPIWGDTDCLQAMREYYAKFYREVEPKVDFIPLDASLASDDVYARVRELLESRVAFAVSKTAVASADI